VTPNADSTGTAGTAGTSGTTAPAEPPETLITARLGAWLADRIDGAERVEVVGVSAPKSGYSAETFMVDTVVHGASGASGASGDRPERYVLRRETPDPAVYPVQVPPRDPSDGPGIEIAVQWQAMSAVAAYSSVPIAPLIGFETDPGVLAAPFFVMGFVDGEVPVENPIYTLEGFFVDASPERRRRMIDHGIDTLAALHRVAWPDGSLDFLNPPGATPGTERQLEVWHDYAQRELDGRHHPLLERAFAWMRDELPPRRPLALSWGDPRPGNMIWRDDRCVCLTDFEAASIAPPVHDLGWWLMFDRWSHEMMDAPRLDGEPTRDEQRDRYSAAIGRDVGDTLFDEVFAAARYTAIVVRVMNRMVARGQMPVEQTYWRDNQASACLASLLPGG
jgi:aminoglycoside phosphotransferase (APT) family kinase protein